MADNSENNTNRLGINVHVIYGIVIIAVVIVFAILLQTTGSKGSLMIKCGDSTVEMKIEEDERTVKGVLDFLFSKEDRRREVKALLKEFYNFYAVSDCALVKEFETQQSSSEISGELRKLLYELRGPFERSLHTFYNIEEPDIVSAIERLGFEHPVSEGLRSLLNYRKGPFEEQLTEIVVSVPEGNPINPGSAASCKENKYYRRDIRIFNKQRTRAVDVFVRGRFPCPANMENNKDIYKLIQLSFQDMRTLIGDAPLAGKEPGYAEINIYSD